MPHLYLFDDADAREWHPLNLTRPVGELLFGCLLQRERIERALGLSCRGQLAGDALVGFEEPSAAPAIAADALPADGVRVVVSSRWVPGPGRIATGEEPAVLRCGDETVGWILGEGDGPVPDEALLHPDAAGAPDAGREIELPGRTVERVWDLIAGNAEQIRSDVPALFPHSDAFLPARVERLGKHPVSVGEGVEMEPGVVLDTREGPIRIGKRAVVRAHSLVRGPAYAGEGTHLLGGVLSAFSAGPVCKLRGEIEESVILGYCNKAHDGFLGHAYLGRWVNLGALTTNSDLKNNYGPVRLGGRDGEIETGLMKLGALLGDHVKTAIGTLLNTGTVVGAGSNLFGGRMPPKYVPPFSWGGGPDGGTYRIDDFLETARRVLDRRDHELPEGMEGVLRTAWERTASLREA